MYDKSTRILYVLEQLLKKNEVKKDEIQEMFKIDNRTFERDIATLRSYLGQRIGCLEDRRIEYDYQKKTYYLSDGGNCKLTSQQVLVLMKLLLGTRGLTVEELDEMIEALCAALDLEEKKRIQSFIGNERLHFIPLKHNKKLVDRIWDFSLAIDKPQKIKMEYKKANNRINFYTIAPVGLVFCDFYFYVVGYVVDRSNPYPISFRLDRILSYEILNESFKIPYSHRFETGDFRNKINMMYQGELIKFTFRFTGHSVEAVLDKIPVSRILEEGDRYYIIEAVSYEQGVLMWILSQGEWIKLLTPNDLVEKMKVKLSHMIELY
ncbi:helix-turn-helix transcriptional regulator [Turicibacter sanguinis]|uniref:helix-turn-helix transcriptional regulator n=1 Tax=Turicibacter sanguinis TaxID=154288 RepID=UPI00189F3B31|nr:WYL domain-containing protein [Turicibacter sanguinis]